MPRTAGRDQVGPMERVVRLLVALADSGPDGLPASTLCRIADLPVDESGLSQLRRDLRQLRVSGGWDIESSGDQGAGGRYVLHAHDNRLELLLSAGERAALQQASMAVGADAPDLPGELSALEHAVERHCLARFTYKHRRRVVHPHALHNGPSGWMLRGREIESGAVKEFVVARIAGAVHLEPPGSSEVPGDAPRHNFDPLSWQLDPPEDVIIAAAPGFADEALQALSGAEIVDDREDEILIKITVTHRAAFCSRIAELGVRVRFVGESATRDRMITMLHAVAGAR